MTRPECRTICSSRSRCRFCVENWSGWSAALGFRFYEAPKPRGESSSLSGLGRGFVMSHKGRWDDSMSHSEVHLRRIDHLRFFVGNAKQSAYFYRNAFGFDVIAYEGLETGVKHEAGYVLRQGQITFVLTSSLRANDPDNMRLMFHGDGIKDIALQVDDVKQAF